MLVPPALVEERRRRLNQPLPDATLRLLTYGTPDGFQGLMRVPITALGEVPPGLLERAPPRTRGEPRTQRSSSPPSTTTVVPVTKSPASRR